MAFATTTVLAVAALATAAAGTYVSYQGMQQQAKTAKEVGRYNAKLAENEAIQTEMNARENSRRAAREARRLLGTQRAAIGKSGIAEAGSPLEVLGETAGQIELDAADRGFEARQEAKRLRAGGAMGLYEAGQTARAAKIGATGTLLSGASNMASMAGTFQYQGAFKNRGAKG